MSLHHHSHIVTVSMKAGVSVLLLSALLCARCAAESDVEFELTIDHHQNPGSQLDLHLTGGKGKGCRDGYLYPLNRYATIIDTWESIRYLFVL